MRWLGDWSTQIMIEINNANRRAINQAKELLNTVPEMKATDTAIALRIALLSFLTANGVKNNVS